MFELQVIDNHLYNTKTFRLNLENSYYDINISYNVLCEVSKQSIAECLISDFIDKVDKEDRYELVKCIVHNFHMMHDINTIINMYGKYLLDTDVEKYLAPTVATNYGTTVASNHWFETESEPVEVAKIKCLSEKVTHPVTKNVMKLKAVIINLNDCYNWTREQIADWLESLDIDMRLNC